MATELGVAYVTLMPSMRGFNKEVRKNIQDLTDTIAVSFGSAGSKAGGSFAEKFKSQTKGLGSQGKDQGNLFGSSFLSQAVGKLQGLTSSVTSAFKSGGWKAAGVAVGGALLSGVASGTAAIVKVGLDMSKAILKGFVDVGQKICSSIVSGVENAYSQAAGIMKKLGSTQISTAAKSLGLNIGGGVTDGLNSAKVAVGNIVSGMISSAAGAVSSSMGSAISRIDTLKAYPKTMANLGVSSELAQKSMDDLSASIDGLPTSLDGIVGFTQKIFPAFNGDIDAATKSAIAFNNALVSGGADATKQSNALEQWSQMMSNGKVDMQSWRSVIEAMPAQMNMVAQAMGKANPTELYNSLVGSKDGTIPLEELNDAFLRLNEEGLNGFASFSEQAKTSAGGIGTAITNVSNRINRALASVMDWVGQENIAGAINSISRNFGPMADKFTAFLDEIDAKRYIVDMASSFGNAIANIAQKAEPLKSALEPLIQNALPAALTIVNNTLDTITSKVDPLVSHLSSFITGLSSQTAQIQPIIDAFVSLEFTTWTAALDMWQKVIAAVAPQMPKILQAQEAVTAAVAGLVGNMSGVIAPIVGNLALTVSDMITRAKPVLEMVIWELAPVFETMFTHISNIWNNVMDIASQGGFIQGIAQSINTILDVAGATIGNIVNTLMPYLPTIAEMAESIVTSLAPAIQNIVDLLAPHIPQVAQLFSDAAALLAPAIEQTVAVLEPYIDPISEMISAAVSFVANNLPGVAGVIGKILGFISPIITDVLNLVDSWLPAIEGFINTFIDLLSWLYDHTLKPIFDLLSDIGDFISDPPWDKIANQFTGNTHTSSTRPVGLASGGIATAPTTAFIAEAGTPEAVVPLSAQGIQKFTSGLNVSTNTTTPTIDIHIDSFNNYDTTEDVRSLSNRIGRDTLLQLRMQGVYA